MKDLCLDKYEILPTEPLHDIGHHIENVFAELPHQLKAKEKKAFQESIAMCLGGKESKRGVDYRAALVKVTAYLRQNGLLSEKELQVLDTLTEMQRILYSTDEKRSPQLILRYYNQSWYHAILLKQYVQQPKKLTLRKMFGVYFHDITAHGGLMLRLVSGQAANAEEEERIFHHIKGITKKTSNYSNSQVIPNLFLRLQAEKQMGKREDVSKQQGYISTLSKSLPPLQNTRIPIDVIKTHAREWQAHLQQISDFLQEGEGVWWHKDDEAVEFHDISGFPSADESGPQLHHFRSSTLKDEEIYLQQCWQQCIQQNIAIPTHIIRIDLPNGRVQKLHTPFLGPPPADTENPPEITIELPPEDSDLLPENEEAATDQPLGPREDGNYEEVIDISPAADEVVELADVTDLSRFPFATEQEIPTKIPLQLPTEQFSQITNINSSEQSTRPEHNVNKQSHTNQEESTTSSANYTMQTRLGKALAVVLL